MDDDPDDDEVETEEDGEISPLLEAAIALHEVYLSLTEGGFAETEALRMLAYILSDEGL